MGFRVVHSVRVSLCADPSACRPCNQVENCKLKDYEGNYERFLEKNEGEADVMAEKEAKKKELEKSQIKAKSKARTACRWSRVCSFPGRTGWSA